MLFKRKSFFDRSNKIRNRVAHYVAAKAVARYSQVSYFRQSVAIALSERGFVVAGSFASGPRCAENEGNKQTNTPPFVTLVRNKQITSEDIC